MTILPFKKKAYLFRSASADAGKFWHNSSRILLSLNFTANCISLTRPSLLSLSQSYPRGVLLTLPLSQTNVFDTVFPAATGEGDLDLSSSLEDSAMVRCLIKDGPNGLWIDIQCITLHAALENSGCIKFSSLRLRAGHEISGVFLLMVVEDFYSNEMYHNYEKKTSSDLWNI